MSLSSCAFPLATPLETTFSYMILVRIRKKMGKNLNLTENELCDDFEDGQSAKWALVIGLCP